MQRRIYSLVLVCGFLASVCAGGVKIDSAIDFSMTDANGKTQHLYEYLDAGKWVLLSFTAQS